MFNKGQMADNKFYIATFLAKRSDGWSTFKKRGANLT